MDETQIYNRLILETDQDYREAITTLDQQLSAASVLADHISVIADAIEAYEKENDIQISETS